MSGLDVFGRLSPRMGARQAAAVVGAAGLVVPTDALYVFGDSLDMRGALILYPTSFTGVSGTQATWGAGVQTYLAPIGSRVRLKGNSSAGLDGYATITAMSSTSITVDYGRDVTGLTGAAAPAIAIFAFRNDTGWINYAQASLHLLGYPVDYVNLGVGGDTALLMYDRLSEVPNDSLVSVCFGANDMVAVAAGTLTQAEQVANGLALLNALLDKGCRLIINSPQPFNSGYSAVSADETAAVNYLLELRRVEQAFALRYSDRCTFVDLFAAMKNSGTNFADTGMISTDSIHSTPLGAGTRAAKFVTDTVAAGLWKKSPSYIPLTAADGVENGGTDYITNPMLEGTSGTVGSGVTASGGVPDDWSVTRTGGTPTVTLSAGDYGGQKISTSWVVSGSTAMQITQSLDASVLGKTLKAAVDIKVVSGGGKGHYLLPTVRYTLDGLVRYVMLSRHQLTYAQGGRWPIDGTTYRLESEEFTIPAAATSPEFFIHCQAGAAGTIVFDVARPSIKDAAVA